LSINAKPNSGEYQAIIGPALWDAVQARVVENVVDRAAGIRVKTPNLLTGARASA
jgi:hypothetical protein